MFKWVSWALRILATGVLLSFLCIWTTGYIVNSYAEAVIKQLGLPLETKPFALSGIWGTLWGVDDPPSKEASEDTKSGVKQADKGEDEEDSIVEEAGRQTDEPAKATNAVDEPGPGASETAEEIAEESESPDASPTGEIGAEDAEPGDAVPVTGSPSEGRELTDAERQALYATVVSKLDETQLQLLSEALDSGLTGEKLTELKQMLQSALTAEEYAQMMQVLQGTTEVATATGQ